MPPARQTRTPHNTGQACGLDLKVPHFISTTPPGATDAGTTDSKPPSTALRVQLPKVKPAVRDGSHLVYF